MYKGGALYDVTGWYITMYKGGASALHKGGAKQNAQRWCKTKCTRVVHFCKGQTSIPFWYRGLSLVKKLPITHTYKRLQIQGVYDKNKLLYNK